MQQMREQSMIAGCPQCGARYRIDLRRLPGTGARVRCARCQGLFRVSPPPAPKPSARPDPESIPPRAAPAPTPPAAPTAAPPAVPVPPPVPEAPAPPPMASAPAAVPPPVPSAPPVAAPAPAGGAPGSAAPAPVGGPPPVAAAPPPDASAAGVTRRPLVLVAEPDLAAGKAVASALVGWGCEVMLVHDGVEAMLGVQRRLPRAVVLHVALPRMFGFQVCEVIKRNASLRETRVILVGTAQYGSSCGWQPSDAYGADAHLERPELPAALHGVLAGFGLVAPPARPEPVSRTAPTLPKGIPAAPPTPRLPVSDAAPTQPRAVSDAAPTQPRVVPDAAPTQPRVVPDAAPTQPSRSGDPELQAALARAERLARVIVSDVVLYHPERFEAAIRSGRLVETMDPVMQEGRQHFEERIDPSVRELRDFLGQELLRVARMRGMKPQ